MWSGQREYNVRKWRETLANETADDREIRRLRQRRQKALAKGRHVGAFYGTTLKEICEVVGLRHGYVSSLQPGALFAHHVFELDTMAGTTLRGSLADGLSPRR